MSAMHPWLMAAAGAGAIAAAILLFRPTRQRVAVSHLGLWREAAEQAGRRRVLRVPQPWLILLAGGGLLLAAAAGSWLLHARRDTPGPVLILTADTVDLDATDSRGRRQRDLLAARLAELRSLLPDGTAVIERSHERGQPIGPTDSSVSAIYLLGRFEPGDAERSGVHWIFCPQPPGRDVGIESAGGEQVGDRVELFVALRRFAGAATSARVVVSADGADTTLAERTVELGPSGRAAAVLDLPREPGYVVRLAEGDDQSHNDSLLLRDDAPPQPGQPAATSSSGVATVRLLGRPNPWIAKAVHDNPRLRQAEPGAEADWLIVNEPAEPISAADAQGLVEIDPLVPPGGVRFVGRLDYGAGGGRLADFAPDAPFGEIPLDGVTMRRGMQVQLDPRWLAVARDEGGHPLIGWRAGARQIAIFFAVGSENTNWPGHLSWPVFWDALADLGRRGDSGSLHWRIARGAQTDDRPIEQVFTPPDARRAEAINSADIPPPPAESREAALSAWRWVALAGVLLLCAGWGWGHRREA